MDSFLFFQEAFHVLFSPVLEYVKRWAFTQNATTGLVGQPGDGTTIDIDEPFILRWDTIEVSQPRFFPRFACDADGWTLRANKEGPYPHFFHIVNPADILTVTLTGDVEISFMGFGDGMRVIRKKTRWCSPVGSRPSLMLLHH